VLVSALYGASTAAYVVKTRLRVNVQASTAGNFNVQIN